MKHPPFMLIILLLTPLALAKGGSSGGTVVKEAPAEPERPDCETFSTVKDRVKCRLEFGQQKETTPEPCRALSVATKCVQYYKDALPCYEKSGKAKDQCFKTTAGFLTKTAKAERAKGEPSLGAIRYYILALLYDLEERVEDAVNDNTLSAERGAELISDIIAIKVKVLEKAPISEIKSDLAELRNNWPGELK